MPRNISFALTTEKFRMFMAHMKCDRDTEVTRIEFEYLD